MMRAQAASAATQQHGRLGRMIFLRDARARLEGCGSRGVIIDQHAYIARDSADIDTDERHTAALLGAGSRFH